MLIINKLAPLHKLTQQDTPMFYLNIHTMQTPGRNSKPMESNLPRDPPMELRSLTDLCMSLVE